MQNPPLKVLFLCTGNSARSIMAEALLNYHGQGRFEAFSAGSKPVGQVNPFVLETLSEIGIPTTDLRSKSWNEFVSAHAPNLDVVITVCDNAAEESCPIWYSTPVQLHWSFTDPAAVQGADMVKRFETRRVYSEIESQIRKFVSLPVENFVPERLEAELRTIAPSK
ncbi:MAG: arsenate reductase ArsC [Rhodospirillaceae bacterium]|nr:arsenate reductase ArsC [Rhodospirillaceae bacterium]